SGWYISTELVFFFFSSRRRHTRSDRDLEFRRVLFRSLGRARSLGETLDTLASAAAREAPRVAVLTVRGGRAHGWRLIGFGALDRSEERRVGKEWRSWWAPVH